MSLPIKTIDRLFERMAATYGAAWTRQWQDVPMADVKTAWAHELSAFASTLSRIAWALDNLPPRCPNPIEFRALCRAAPVPEAPRLPEPVVNPNVLQAELSRLEGVRRQITTQEDPKAWARRLIAKHEAGQWVRPISLRFAREALRLHLGGGGEGA